MSENYALVTYYADGTNGVTFYRSLETAEQRQKDTIMMLGAGCEACEIIKFESVSIKNYDSYR